MSEASSRVATWPHFIYSAIFSLIIKLNHFPLPTTTLGVGKQLRILLGGVSLEVTKCAGWMPQGWLSATSARDGNFDSVGDKLIYTLINDLIVIRQLLQVTDTPPNSLHACLLQRHLFIPPFS